ncbi:hypothetical protein [Actinotalea sp.]|uniref:hypothetical protein n=1 Tax=Actinotalea sp. TaxID=1872145 RepID=UPI0035693BA3
MFVMTVDQEGSRSAGDRVPELLEDLAAAEPARYAIRPFSRTVGDEVQAVFADPERAVSTALMLLRRGGWSVGLGAGPVDEPLPAESRAGSGPAFVLAREAVERAKSRSRPVPLAVVGVDADRAGECEAVLTMLGSVSRRRSEAGWAAVDALLAQPRGSQEDLARTLGISQQAVSQRLRGAQWYEEAALVPLAVRLLEEAQG